MGQQEEDHEATGARQSARGSEGHSLTWCLDELLLAVDLHRLVFLCGITVELPPGFPRKPPRVMDLKKVPVRRLTKEKLAGADEDFIRELRAKLERNARHNLRRLGAGKGLHWYIDPDGADYLEGSSDRIFAACRGLSAEDSDGAYKDLVDSAMRVTHDSDHPTWNARKEVRSEYLEELDTVVKNVKEATVRVRRSGAGPDGSKEPSAGSRDTTEGPRPANTSGSPTVNVQNANNVVLGNIQQNQNLVSGDHRFADGEASTSQRNKKNVKRIIASVSLLATVLTVLQILFGWIEAIWHLLTRG